MRAIRICFVVALVIAVLEAIWYYPITPDPMAVHFNASGVADGWGPKQSFFSSFGVVFFIMIIIFGGFSRLIRRLPDSLINLPNKDYWLAPERRKETYDRITDQMLFFGATSIFLLDIVLFLSLRANLIPGSGLPAGFLWGILGGFIVINILWTIYVLRSLRRPRS
jgi:uncharacterized membrane protein